MECGTPYCHSVGCPLKNLIPEWNDAVAHSQWDLAYERLDLTNNFPEFTGQVCPAPCEDSCTLSFDAEPVSIKQTELAIIEKAFLEGRVKPVKPLRESGKKVAVVGSGPAGLAAAQQLRRRGHRVIVFERDLKPGGLLRYGVPDFKLEKYIIDRRIAILEEEGISFKTGVHIGQDLLLEDLRRDYDGVLLALGALEPIGLNLPGIKLKGVHQAMDYLVQANKRLSGEPYDGETIHGKNKNILVLGDGDTGSDCIGTAVREGAARIIQYARKSKPMEWKKPWNPEWPYVPQTLRLSSSQKEGGERDWEVQTLGFEGRNGVLKRGLFCRGTRVKKDDGRVEVFPIPNSEFQVDLDMVLLAIGFKHVEHGPLLSGIRLDRSGNIRTDRFETSLPGVFAAGDAVEGASLVVTAIRQGREAARALDHSLSSSRPG